MSNTKPFSDEHKKKISLSLLGNERAVGNKSNLGREFSEGHKRRLSFIQVGNKNAKGSIKNKVTKLKMSVCHLGSKNGKWKGGISYKVALRLRKATWKNIANAIRLRDKNTCQLCGVNGNDKILSVHHIIPYRLTGNNSEENLITLCAICHMKEEYKFELQTRFLKDILGV